MAHTSTMQGNGSPVMAFMAGLAAGALTALLFAPRSGQEMRKEIKERAMTARDKVQDKVAEQAKTVRQGVDKATDTVTNMLEQGQEAVEEGRKRANDSIDNASGANTNSTTKRRSS